MLFQPRGGADLGSETDEAGAAPGVGGDDRVMRGSAYDIWSVGVLWLELITGSSKVWVRHFAQSGRPLFECFRTVPPARPLGQLAIGFVSLLQLSCCLLVDCEHSR